MKPCGVFLCAAAALVGSEVSWSQGDAAPASDSEAGAKQERPSPLAEGFYVAPMASYVVPYSNRGIDNGLGGALSLGYRFGVLALEATGTYAKLDAKEDGADKAELSAAHIGLLWFPLERIQGLYTGAAVGRARTDDQPVGDIGFEADSIEAALGYLFPLSLGRYAFGVRSEARVRFSERGRPLALGDDNQPRRFQDVLINLGLQLPLGLKALPPPPPEPPAVIVPVEPPDSDADGVQDNLDQCPGTPAGAAIDEKGCSVPTCAKPQPGERISLNGCGVGDVIVLNGVNFEFDKARLTTNAETILNQVADELTSHADITVELAGHTDSLGSDEYNRRLSDRRAAAVKQYLTDRAIAGDRITAVGLGESQPVDSNETEEGRENNRRVELKILSGGGSAVTVAPPVGAGAAAASPADAAAPGSSGTESGPAARPTP